MTDSCELSHLHLRLYRHTWPQEMVLVLIRIEHDAHGNALHDFHVVARCVLRRKETEAGAARATDRLHFAVVIATGRVHFDIDWLAGFHVLELRFFEVGGDPNVLNIDERHECLTRLHVLPDFGGAMSDDPMYRRGDLRVLQI